MGRSFCGRFHVAGGKGKSEGEAKTTLYTPDLITRPLKVSLELSDIDIAADISITSRVKFSNLIPTLILIADQLARSRWLDWLRSSNTIVVQRTRAAFCLQARCADQCHPMPPHDCIDIRIVDHACKCYCIASSKSFVSCSSLAVVA